MEEKPDLHAIRITCQPSEVEQIEQLFEESSLAISSFAPPRTDEAVVEVLVDGMPDSEYLKNKLASYGRFTIDKVEDIDWVKKVSDDFPPLKLARWTIYGASHADEVEDKSLGLQIDATSAFGTGEHPTTAGCLVALDKLLTSVGEKAHNWKLLDMGCGSGILAMAFAKALKGTEASAIGVDMDEQSIEIAKENAVINGIEEGLELFVNTGYQHERIEAAAPFDLIMANIFADPLCDMAPELKAHLKRGGHVILSGILTTQADAVIAVHTAHGLRLETRKEDGEWYILEFTYPKGA